MPPKAAPAKAAEAAASQANVSLTATIFKLNGVTKLSPRSDETSVTTLPPVEGYRLRIFSKWASCGATSPIFGDPAVFTWEVAEGSEVPKASFTVGCDGTVSAGDSLKSFHADPMIYIFFTYVTFGGIQMRSFVAVDCSAFLTELTTIKIVRRLDDNHEVEVLVKNVKPFMDWAGLLPLQPLRLRLKSLCNFPMHSDDTPRTACASAYVFTAFEVTPGVLRPILAFPSLGDNTGSLSATTTLDGSVTLGDTLSGPGGVQRKNRFDLFVYLLPGLGDLARFRDSLASTNYSLQVYDDDVLQRAFSSASMAEYVQLLGSEGGAMLPDPPAAVQPVAVAAPAGKGAKAPAKAAPAKSAPPVGEIKSSITSTSSTPMTPSDQMLLTSLMQALANGPRVRNHGTGRFRLERLLDKASDLLAKFARKRKEGLSVDDHVVVKEELLVDVRLEKPSHPEKWDLPSDLSLLAALQKAKANAGILVKKKPEPPKHELFLTCHTSLSVTVELHRRLAEEVQQIDSAVMSPVKKLRPRGQATPIEAGVTTATKGTGSSSSAAASPSSLKSPGAKSPARKKSVVAEKKNLTPAEVLGVLAETPFTRIIVLMRYNDDELLRSLNEGLTAINSKALPNIQGTVRSYSLTPAEREAALTGGLDLISGFMIIDDDLRMLVLEGLAAPNCAMENLYIDYLYREKANDEDLTILCNPEVLFPERSYVDFCPDVRRIRVRGKLKKLVRRPEIYNRQQVDEICFEAVDHLMQLKRAEDLRSTKALDMYPSMESLNKLELLYGEAITRADMDGTLKIEFVQTHENRKSRRELQQTLQQASGAHSVDGSSRSSWQPTDCRNTEFEDILRNRPAHRVDHLAEHRKLRRQAWRDMLHRRQQRDTTLTETITKVLGTTTLSATKTITRTNEDGDEVQEEVAVPGEPPKIYLYSHQKENFKAKMWDQLRQKVAADNNATYTFSQDFVSQTVCPIDEDEERKRQAALSKQQMMTKGGFQYPKPKTRRELVTHPQRPSEARIEDLKEPFTDVLDRKQTDSSADPHAKTREQGFSTRFRSSATFGALQEPAFEHEFQLKLIGDRTQLPRGQLVRGAEPNPGFFRSVHLGGDDQARIVAEAIAKEKEEWQAKVVVETLDFKVGGMKVRDRPIQADRAGDILHDAPKKQALKHLREMRSHRGADFSLTTPPLSVFAQEPYVENALTNALLRTQDPSKFVTAALSTLQESRPSSQEEPGPRRTQSLRREMDFQRYVHADTFRPKLQAVVGKRKHPPQDPASAECHGAKWDPPSAST